MDFTKSGAHFAARDAAQTALFAMLLSSFVLNVIGPVMGESNLRSVLPAVTAISLFVGSRIPRSAPRCSRGRLSQDPNRGVPWKILLLPATFSILLITGFISALRVYGLGNLDFLPSEDNSAWLQVSSTLAYGDTVSTGFGFGIVYFLILTRIPVLLWCFMAGHASDTTFVVSTHVYFSYLVLLLGAVLAISRLVLKSHRGKVLRTVVLLLASTLVVVELSLFLIKSGHMTGLLLAVSLLLCIPDPHENVVRGRRAKVDLQSTTWLLSFSLWLPTHNILLVLLVGLSLFLVARSLTRRFKFNLSDHRAARVLVGVLVALLSSALALSLIVPDFELRTWLRLTELGSLYFSPGGTARVPVLISGMVFGALIAVVSRGGTLPASVLLLLLIDLSLRFIGLVVGQGDIYGVSKAHLIITIPLAAVALTMASHVFGEKASPQIFALLLVFLLMAMPWRGPRLLNPTIDFVQQEYGLPSILEPSDRFSWRDDPKILSSRVSNLPIACVVLDRSSQPRGWFEGYLCSRFLGWTSQTNTDGRVGVSNANTIFRNFGIGRFGVEGLVVRASFLPEMLQEVPILLIENDGSTIKQVKLINFLSAEVFRDERI